MDVVPYRPMPSAGRKRKGDTGDRVPGRPPPSHRTFLSFDMLADKLADPKVFFDNNSERERNGKDRLSPTTVKGYVQSLYSLAGRMRVLPPENSKTVFDLTPWLEDCKRVIEFIKLNYATTPGAKLTTMTALQSVVARYKLVPVTEECIARYKAEFSKDVAERNERSDAAPAHHRILDITWVDVLKGWRKLGDTQYGSMDHLITSLYICVPPRRLEYRTVQFISEEAFALVAPGLVGKNRVIGANYLIIAGAPADDLSQGTSARIALYDFKTVSKLGPYHARWPSKLTNIALANLKTRKTAAQRKYLISSQTSDHYSQSTGFSNRVKTAFLNGIGHDLSLNDLRHLFITFVLVNRHNITNAMLKGLAYKIGHSLKKFTEYFRVNGTKPSTQDVRDIVVSFLAEDDADFGAHVTSAADIRLFDETEAAIHQPGNEQYDNFYDDDDLGFDYREPGQGLPSVEAMDQQQAHPFQREPVDYDAMEVGHAPIHAGVPTGASGVVTLDKESLKLQLKITLGIFARAGITLSPEELHEVLATVYV